MAERAPTRSPPRSLRAPAGRVEAIARFRQLDRYRVEREWRRYEGTAQRELIRELRRHFLARHPPVGPGPALEIGPGPGRFSADVGDREHPRVLADLALEALRQARRRLAEAPAPPAGTTHLVRADARDLPFRSESFSLVVLMGNVLGFAGPDAERCLAGAIDRLRPGGELLLELVAGGGERSRYLHRLPVGAVRRLLAAPPSAVLPRIAREGFAPGAPGRAEAKPFRRVPWPGWGTRLERAGLESTEVLAVAPATGSEPELVEAVRADDRAWRHLLEIEEAVGRSPARHPSAAALLVAVRRPGRTPGRSLP